jgi:hypothetical protein
MHTHTECNDRQARIAIWLGRFDLAIFRLNDLAAGLIHA